MVCLSIFIYKIEYIFKLNAVLHAIWPKKRTVTLFLLKNCYSLKEVSLMMFLKKDMEFRY